MNRVLPGIGQSLILALFKDKTGFAIAGSEQRTPGGACICGGGIVERIGSTFRRIDVESPP